MKIGIYDPYLDDIGGGEKYMMKIAQCLSKEHDVSVFWDDEVDLEKLIQRFSLNLSKVKLKKNIFSRNVNFIERFFATKEFDAIFVLSDGSIPLVLSRKLFLHFQQPIEHKPKLSIKEKLKLLRVNLIFCNSKFTKLFIDKIFNTYSKVIYPPVDFFWEKTKKENIILNVGRLRVRDYKKQGFMIETFKKLIEMGLESWKFVIVVSINKKDEEAFKSLQKSADGFPIEFVVNQNNKKLWNIYNRSKIYWHATGFGEDLNSHPEYAEHFGISTVEAMGAGAVPVVINAGGQKEIVENGKNGFLWDTTDQLLTKTQALIKDQKLWSKMSKEARNRSAEFIADKFCRELNNLIK